MSPKYHVELRAAYADTDQMGFVHHSNYVRYLENARWEAFRLMGIAYKDVEDRGILMPVIEMKLQFIKPIYYDDLLKIELSFHMVRPTKLGVDYCIFNQADELIHKADTTLAFIKKESKRPCAIPDFINNKIMAELEVFT
jgi:acyl-CoA thioester hydrolase